jgi:hypothetical protein
MGDRRRRWSRYLRVFPLGGKLPCLDPTVTLARDAVGQRGVFETIADGVTGAVPRLPVVAALMLRVSRCRSGSAQPAAPKPWNSGQE